MSSRSNIIVTKSTLMAAMAVSMHPMVIATHHAIHMASAPTMQVVTNMRDVLILMVTETLTLTTILTRHLMRISITRERWV